MLLDTSFNLEQTVLGNLYLCFADAARKCFEYLKCLPAPKRSTDGLLISKCGLARIVDLVCRSALVSGKTRSISGRRDMGKDAADDVQRQFTTLQRWRRPRCGARGRGGGRRRGRATSARLADVIHNGELRPLGCCALPLGRKQLKKALWLPRDSNGGLVD